MPIVVIHLMFGTVFALIGAFLGWFLRGARTKRSSQQLSEEARHARIVLERLHKLASSVADHVGEHNTRVEEINEGLAAFEGENPEIVLEAVAKLIDANSLMQEQLSEAEEKLQAQARLVESETARALTDALTGLANRRAFDDEMERRREQRNASGEAFSMILLDVDHFKKFNDTHGHQAGDEVLRGLADLLARSTRKGDTAARYGGEEFAMIMPGADVKEGSQIAQRLRENIRRAHFQYAEVALQVTVSVGVACSRRNESTATQISRADEALYASKEAGRDCVHWHDGVRPQPFVEPEVPAEEAPAEKPPAADAPAAASVDVGSKPADVKIDADPDLPVNRISSRTDFFSKVGQRVSEWSRGGAAPAVLLVRIDGYSSILADGGRETAETICIATSQFLAAALRDMDSLGRYDADTFAVLLPSAPAAAAVKVGERMREAIAATALSLPTGPTEFTVSLGGAVAADGDNASKLLRRGEEALKAANQFGGNCSFFHNGHWPETAETTVRENPLADQAPDAEL